MGNVIQQVKRCCPTYVTKLIGIWANRWTFLVNVCVVGCQLPPCHQSQQGAIAFLHEVLTADPLYVNCPSTPFPQNQQEVFAFSCEVSTVAPLYVNCWYAPHNSGSTKGNCLFTQCWLQILSMFSELSILPPPFWSNDSHIWCDTCLSVFSGHSFYQW